MLAALGRSRAFLQERTLGFSSVCLRNIQSHSIRRGTPEGGLKGNGVIALRREDKNRWERRVPLAPNHVATLVSRGVQVIVQPSTLRVYRDEEYAQAGAVLQEDVSPASVILGVKEVPKDLLIPDRTYCFFSHTIKAQPYNMGLLDEILRKNIRLIDYERVVDGNGQRLIRFGKFAGYAGMIDFFHAFGNRLLALGYSTPFLHIGYSHMYPGLENAMASVFAMGREIATQGLPKALQPILFVFSGTGACTSGALEIFRLLPHKFVTVDELPDLMTRHESEHCVYGLIASSDTYIQPKDGGSFKRKEFYANPENFTSVFAEKIAPYMTCLVNCTYWDFRYPRILPIEDTERLKKNNNLRLIGVADISCDIQGGVEMMKRVTTIDHPLFMYDIDKRTVHENIEGDGVMFLAVDNLPTELPREASKYFGDHLAPFVHELAYSDGTRPFAEQDDLPVELHRATITNAGVLTPDYQYISELRRKSELFSKRQNVLVLGAGLVARPVVEYLCQFRTCNITVASAIPGEAENLTRSRTNISPIVLDVSDEEALSRAVKAADVVISLIPAPLHPTVARACIKHRKHMITTSYVSPEMEALSEEAERAGITILNEVGLDPGIDHLTAIKFIHEVKDNGGKITSFTSFCGGLPAPESSANPLGYKFSWSPRGALTALRNPAKFLLNGKVCSESNALACTEPKKIFNALNLEGYPNRDSKVYAGLYGIEDAHTVVRGTLRYTGFARTMNLIAELRLLDTTTLPILAPGSANCTWTDVVSALWKEKVPAGKLVDFAASKVAKNEEDANILSHTLTWLGMTGDESVPKVGTPLDALCAVLQRLLSFGPHERDLVVLCHEFGVQWADGTREVRQSTLVEYGDPRGYSAMAKTVGIPCGIATKLVMDGAIIRKGVLRPLTPDIYIPMLTRLEQEGIIMTERVLARE
eukprot:CAMPEP_0177670150 /NCGR_PEP_ID=MMETSP0447-20121125/23907_1 /TAXON_ID=0 /ORGANISM="Stygamoeba regulata, Strain BSH-02190019" /LENGTH=930 /DNA_ID=CAMNT_0019177237 /DNA_START=53 /DNA_END=2845 /DNA_ORIENTATION=-